MCIRDRSVCPSIYLSTFHIFILFSRTTWPISTKASFGKGNQIDSNEGTCIFPRGDNYEIAIIHRRNLKTFFTRTIMPISTKLGAKHLLVKGIIQSCSNEGPRPFLREIITKLTKLFTLNKFKWRRLKVLQIKTIQLSKRRYCLFFHVNVMI